MGGTITQFLLDNALPAQYVWAVFAGFAVLGVLMMFRGRLMWKIITGLGGAGVGFFLMYHYLIPYMHTPISIGSHSFNLLIFPAYLWELIIAVIAGIIAGIIIRTVISGSIAYGVFYLFTHFTIPYYHPTAGIYGIPYETLAIAVLAFAIAYWLYGSLSKLIAGSLGAFMVFIGLSHFLPQMYAVIPILILMPLGMYLQFHKDHSFHDPDERAIRDRKRARRRTAMRVKLEKARSEVAKLTGSTIGRRDHGPQ